MYHTLWTFVVYNFGHIGIAGCPGSANRNLLGYQVGTCEASQDVLLKCSLETFLSFFRTYGYPGSGFLKIEGDGSDTIVIEGVPELSPADHRVIPDRIEAGTFMIAAAMTGGDVHMEGVRPDHLSAVIEKLRSVGAELKTEADGMHIRGPASLQAADIRTMPFPGFPTDLQAQFMALMTVARGSSIIKETIFENRFIHVSELKRMGADIEINGNQALVRGRDSLLAAPVMATDLRASASLILAGLVARGGTTEVRRIYHLDRGYEALETKFHSLGARIWREKA